MKVAVDDVVLGDGSPSFVGAVVKVEPRRKGGHDGYLAVVRRVEEHRGGVEVTVAAVAPRKCNQPIRTYTPDRLRRPTAAELRTVGAER